MTNQPSVIEKAKRIQSLVHLAEGKVEGQEDTIKYLAEQELSRELSKDNVVNEIGQAEVAIQGLFGAIEHLASIVNSVNQPRPRQQYSRLPQSQAPQYPQNHQHPSNRDDDWEGGH